MSAISWGRFHDDSCESNTSSPASEDVTTTVKVKTLSNRRDQLRHHEFRGVIVWQEVADDDSAADDDDEEAPEAVNATCCSLCCQPSCCCCVCVA